MHCKPQSYLCASAKHSWGGKGRQGEPEARKHVHPLTDNLPRRMSLGIGWGKMLILGYSNTLPPSFQPFPRHCLCNLLYQIVPKEAIFRLIQNRMRKGLLLSLLGKEEQSMLPSGISELSLSLALVCSPPTWSRGWEMEGHVGYFLHLQSLNRVTSSNGRVSASWDQGRKPKDKF